MVDELFLAGAVRTPIGNFGGALAEVSAASLGAAAIKGVLARAGISQIDEVIMGNVIAAGNGQNPARQAAIGAGLADSVPAVTINKVCGSGLKAVMMAAAAIRAGDASAIVAGGMESMSRAPKLIEKGKDEPADSFLRDGLIDAYTGMHMGIYGNCCAEKCGISRGAQDAFAIASYERTLQAMSAGAFAGEIVSVGAVAEDERPKRFNREKMLQLQPSFGGGTITAGNASGVNDGAAAMVVLSESRMKAEKIAPQARILGYASFSGAPEWFTLAPVGAIKSLLANLSLKIADIDLFEINEAFAVVPLAAMKELAIPHEKTNIRGGAVALGHPIGASGARILVTLVHAMRARAARIGVAALCIGGGEAVAMAVESA